MEAVAVSQRHSDRWAAITNWQPAGCTQTPDGDLRPTLPESLPERKEIIFVSRIGRLSEIFIEMIKAMGGGAMGQRRKTAY